MKDADTKAKFASIDFWQGLKTVAWIALILIAVAAALRGSSIFPVATHARMPSWLLAWAGFVALVALLPRAPAALRLGGLGWRAQILICCFALGLFPMLAARGTDFHSIIGSALILGMFAAIFSIAAAESMKARRRRDATIIDGEDAEHRALAQLLAVHPLVIARIDQHFAGERRKLAHGWFTQPHPALSNQRPIDVLRQPGGERMVLHAFDVGPIL